ncbi:VOC family protein [Robbsia sp. KACC 23696]|uniref:VOC family protein n=1 Tax=Robbsia sp. KACC 23696 TaxID=3149231 RepID=UPI00325AE74B
MQLVSVRIITADLQRIVPFYERITGIPITMLSDDFGELRTAACTLAIGSTRTLAFFDGEIARPAENRTAILEFRVDDVDAVFERLADFIAPCLVQAPKTMPWGNRSLLFRDPDGNLINFFTPGAPPRAD